MALLRKHLHDRQLQNQQSQGWYETLFKNTPWLTTLVSSLIGPLVILILLLTFGPCILNKLVTFVREQVSTDQPMVLKS